MRIASNPKVVELEPAPAVNPREETRGRRIRWGLGVVKFELVLALEASMRLAFIILGEKVNKPHFQYFACGDLGFF